MTMRRHLNPSFGLFILALLLARSSCLAEDEMTTETFPSTCQSYAFPGFTVERELCFSGETSIWKRVQVQPGGFRTNFMFEKDLQGILDVQVTWVDDNSCDVTVNGQSCTSCNKCMAREFSADCSNLPHGRKVLCEEVASDYPFFPLQEDYGLVAPTDSPTPAPTQMPTEVIPLVEVRLPTITMPMINVGSLTAQDSKQWATTTAEWFENYYNNDYQEQQDVRRTLRAKRNSRGDINTEIALVSQQVSVDDNGVPTNELTYSQRVTYPMMQEEEEEEGGHEMDQLSIAEIATIPFRDESANEKLAVRLASTIQVFENVQYPLQVPKVEGQPSTGRSKLATIALVCVILMLSFAIPLLVVRYCLIPYYCPTAAGSYHSGRRRSEKESGVVEWEG